jgi:hypothetical protein
MYDLSPSENVIFWILKSGWLVVWTGGALVVWLLYRWLRRRHT